MTIESFWSILKKNELDFFTGVPDSTFAPFMSFLNDNNGNELQNIIASNECEAVANAIGYYLSTSNLPVVYMQNSGEGKVVNPITSLAHKDVYSIPMLLLIGWRGEPGKKDEPQHVKMGKVTLEMLELLDIEYRVVDLDNIQVDNQINELKKLALKNASPVALVIKKGLFEPYSEINKLETEYSLTREEIIEYIVSNIDVKDAIISTTGKASRELFEIRVKRDEQPNDFYTVGGMGCASSIANVISMYKKDRKVFVIDGDGAAIMQLGNFATVGHYKSDNFYHIIIDNSVHESTGSQPTVSSTLSFDKLALDCGYKNAYIANDEIELKNKFIDFYNSIGPSILVVKSRSGSRKDLGRPTVTTIDNKISFMKKIKE